MSRQVRGQWSVTVCPRGAGSGHRSGIAFVRHRRGVSIVLQYYGITVFTGLPSLRQASSRFCLTRCVQLSTAVQDSSSTLHPCPSVQARSAPFSLTQSSSSFTQSSSRALVSPVQQQQSTSDQLFGRSGPEWHHWRPTVSRAVRRAACERRVPRLTTGPGTARLLQQTWTEPISRLSGADKRHFTRLLLPTVRWASADGRPSGERATGGRPGRAGPSPVSGECRRSLKNVAAPSDS